MQAPGDLLISEGVCRRDKYVMLKGRITAEKAAEIIEEKNLMPDGYEAMRPTIWWVTEASSFKEEYPVFQNSNKGELGSFAVTIVRFKLIGGKLPDTPF